MNAVLFDDGVAGVRSSGKREVRSLSRVFSFGPRPEGRQRHDADQIIQAATQSRDVFRRRSESGVHVTPPSGPARPRRRWCVALSQSIDVCILGSS